MIRSFDDPAGQNPDKFNPHALLQSLERHLSQNRRITETKAEAAQQLIYDAWEAATEEEAKTLIFSALKLDPMNADALLRAGEYAGLEGGEEIEYLRKVVAAGEKSLGPKAFKEFEGYFWGFIETRPYMRARERLAAALYREGRLDEAMAEWNAMLDLNPGDNQGVRYLLLPVALRLNRLEAARKLFETYPGDVEFNTVFAWGRVLERFLAGDLPDAVTALAAARKQNSHTQACVNGHRSLPKDLPGAYAPGSKEEAICYAEGLRAAWKQHPAALKWLKAQKVK